MRIGLASDSRGNVELLARALESLEAAGAERIFFLGASCVDVDRALRSPGRTAGQRRALAARIACIASRGDDDVGAAAPAKLLELVGGALCCLVHDKRELGRDDIANATFVFHGNSPAPALRRFGPRYFVTPGSLAPGGADGAPRTWATLEVAADRVELVVYGEDGGERERVREGVVAAAGARVKVR